MRGRSAVLTNTHIMVNIFKKSAEWSSFAEYKEDLFSMWKVTQPTAAWAQSTCPVFAKRWKCKHVIAYAIKRKVAHDPSSMLIGLEYQCCPSSRRLLSDIGDLRRRGAISQRALKWWSRSGDEAALPERDKLSSA